MEGEMRWRRTELTRLALLLLAIGAATACVIGPKQDDPAAPGVNLGTDASIEDTEGDNTNADTGGGLTTGPDGSTDEKGDADVAAPPSPDTGCVGDASDAGCADTGPDAASDALSDAPEGG